jgi:pyruvate,orthophosphate dikinase
VKRIFRFSQNDCDWSVGEDNDGISYKSIKHVLGGKGAALVEMCGLGMRVPPGFTITTAVCNEYRKTKAECSPSMVSALIGDLMADVMGHMTWLEEQFTYIPLVSVRSGAPVSMPGMMDTILNVGLTTMIVDEWGTRIGERAAFDSYRRLIQMLGATAYNVPSTVFEHELQLMKKEAKVTLDAELDPPALKALCFMYSQKFKAVAQKEFPNTLEEQLRAAIVAVFDSWMNPRAIEYRKLNNISEDMGTAVTVQAMVFGNMGDDSGSGVLFSRDPSTGEPKIMGEYLANAQGEDVVAGIRTPDNLDTVHATWCGELEEMCWKLEAHYKDMVDIEFTVQKGELFILQSRAGKRSARAAFKIAYDLVQEEVITRAQALDRLTSDQFKVARRPGIDPKFKTQPNLTGLPACPGVAVGKPVFDCESAINCTEPCILVTHETTPDDIAGMAKAVGILTQTGGATSHAAVVARAMDKACVVGCTDMEFQGTLVGSKGVMWPEGAKITIDGATGRVWVGIDVPVIDSSDAPEVRAVMDWCMEKTGSVQPYVVDPAAEITTPYRIMASAWWGDDAVLEVVLETLAEKPSREHIVLDLTPPWQRKMGDDMALDGAFTDISHDHLFLGVINKALVEMAPGLKGLILLNYMGNASSTENMRSLGYVVPSSPQTVADLMKGAVGEPTGEFIDKVIGGHEAWGKIKKALVASGFPMTTVPPAVPPDYAVFTVLRA